MGNALTHWQLRGWSWASNPSPCTFSRCHDVVELGVRADRRGALGGGPGGAGGRPYHDHPPPAGLAFEHCGRRGRCRCVCRGVVRSPWCASSSPKVRLIKFVSSAPLPMPAGGIAGGLESAPASGAFTRRVRHPAEQRSPGTSCIVAAEVACVCQPQRNWRSRPGRPSLGSLAARRPWRNGPAPLS